MNFAKASLDQRTTSLKRVKARLRSRKYSETQIKNQPLTKISWLKSRFWVFQIMSHKGILTILAAVTAQLSPSASPSSKILRITGK